MRAHGGKFVVDLALDWKERTRNTERSDRTLTNKVAVRKGAWGLSKGQSHESYIGDDKKPEEALVAELFIIPDGGGSCVSSPARTKIRPKLV